MRGRVWSVVVLSCVFVVLVGAFPASAVKPAKFDTPFEDLTLPAGAACGAGDVHIHVVQDNLFQTTFFDSTGAVIREGSHGASKVTLTDLTSNKTVALNISGPGTFTSDADGDLLHGGGNWLFLVFSNLPQQILYTTGGFDARIVNNTLTFLSGPAQITDICPKLS